MDVFKISVPNGIALGTFDNTSTVNAVIFKLLLTSYLKSDLAKKKKTTIALPL